MKLKVRIPSNDKKQPLSVLGSIDQMIVLLNKLKEEDLSDEDFLKIIDFCYEYDFDSDIKSHAKDRIDTPDITDIPLSIDEEIVTKKINERDVSQERLMRVLRANFTKEKIACDIQTLIEVARKLIFAFRLSIERDIKQAEEKIAKSNKVLSELDKHDECLLKRTLKNRDTQ